MTTPDKPKHKGEGHRERLRQRFLGAGLEGFHDYEVIELLLTLATPRKDCKDAAKAALARFKTLQGVLEATAEELMEVPGIGPKNMFGVTLVKSVSKRLLEKKVVHKQALSHSAALFDYLTAAMRDKTRECFKAVFLDCEEPRDRRADPLGRDIDRQQRLPARSGCGGAQAPCRRAHLRPQPPLGGPPALG